MGDPKGFMKYAREGPKRKPIELRVLDWKEMYEPIPEDKLKTQGARPAVSGDARQAGDPEERRAGAGRYRVG